MTKVSTVLMSHLEDVKFNTGIREKEEENIHRCNFMKWLVMKFKDLSQEIEPEKEHETFCKLYPNLAGPFIVVDFLALSKELKAFTASNNHTEADLLLSRALENKEAEEKILAIQKDQERRGYLTPEMNRERFVIYQQLMTQMKSFGENNYRLIHSSL